MFLPTSARAGRCVNISGRYLAQSFIVIAHQQTAEAIETVPSFHHSQFLLVHSLPNAVCQQDPERARAHCRADTTVICPPPLPNEIEGGHQQAIWESGADCDPPPPGYMGGWVGWSAKILGTPIYPCYPSNPPPPLTCPTNTSVWTVFFGSLIK